MQALPLEPREVGARSLRYAPLPPIQRLSPLYAVASNIQSDTYEVKLRCSAGCVFKARAHKIVGYDGSSRTSSPASTLALPDLSDGAIRVEIRMIGYDPDLTDARDAFHEAVLQVLGAKRVGSIDIVEERKASQAGLVYVVLDIAVHVLFDDSASLLAGGLALAVETGHCALASGQGQIDPRYGVLQLFSGSDQTLRVAPIRGGDAAWTWVDPAQRWQLAALGLAALLLAGCCAAWACVSSPKALTKRVGGPSFQLVNIEADDGVDASSGCNIDLFEIDETMPLSGLEAEISLLGYDDEQMAFGEHYAEQRQRGQVAGVSRLLSHSERLLLGSQGVTSGVEDDDRSHVSVSTSEMLPMPPSSSVRSSPGTANSIHRFRL